MAVPEDLPSQSTESFTLEETKKAIAAAPKQKTEDPEEITWKDLNTILEKFPIEGGSGWADVVAAERIDNKQRYLRIRRYKQGYNIWTAEDLTGIIEALKAGSQFLEWKSGESQYQKMADEIRALRAAKSKQLEKMQGMSKLIAELREQQLNLELPKFKNDLKEFQNLLDGSSTNEHDLQEFLESHSWLFGPEYLDEQPVYFKQFQLSDSRFDFMLQRYDTFYDIFEIKQPSVDLFKNKPEKMTTGQNLISATRDSPISSDLNAAISQMIGYLESAEIWANSLFRAKGILLHKPKGVIVIGRSKKTEQEAIRTLNFYLNHFEVITYDDLLNKGKEFVKMIERRKLKSIKKSNKRQIAD